MGCQEHGYPVNIVPERQQRRYTRHRWLMMQTFLHGFLPSQQRSVSITAVGIYFDPLLWHEMHNFVLSHNNCNGATQLQSRQPGCQTNSLISGFPRTKLPSSYLALFTLSISLITAGKVYLWHIGRLYFPSE